MRCEISESRGADATPSSNTWKWAFLRVQILQREIRWYGTDAGAFKKISLV